jgi:hypothetical protein
MQSDVFGGHAGAECSGRGFRKNQHWRIDVVQVHMHGGRNIVARNVEEELPATNFRSSTVAGREINVSMVLDISERLWGGPRYSAHPT